MREVVPAATGALVFGIPLVLSLALGRPMIGALRRLKAGQRVRDDGPQRHLQKEGTPTMGGVMIVGTMVIGIAIGAVASGPEHRRQLLALLLAAATTVAFAAVGFADDYLKIKRGRSLGLKARQKLLLQFVAAGLVVYLFAWRYHSWVSWGDAWLLAQRQYAWWMLLWVLALVGASNAMNMADGLDGLATGLCVVAAAGFAALGVMERNPPVAVMALTVAGACLGFLWFNRHPARVFMGDVGSLALGAAMGMMALLLSVGSSLRLAEPVVALAGLCLVPFTEAASVVIQVVSFKSTGKRVFKMSPIHHHFELSGWSERRVVWTFWAVAAVATAATVGLMPVRVK
jgi:phospho-N-acetylmuramoyl-pentapeptide-transferase